MRTDLIRPRLSSLRAFAPVLATALMLGVALPSPAQAQEPGPEDLRALIYYLDHDDQRSVQAEMRRLRAQFPRWTPPGDMRELRAMGQTATASVDVQPIWSRIERQDYAGARALIDEARARVPGWSPDAEMLRVLETNESQAAFDDAYARRDVAGAVAAARRTPALMRCDRINNAWRLAELYDAADQAQNAVTTFRGVLQSCTRLSDAVPTLEKANEVTTWEQMTELFGVARQAQPANAERLNSLEERLRAGRGGEGPARTAATAPAATTRAPTPAPTPAPAPVQAVAAAGPAPAETPVAVGSLPLRGDSRVAQVRQHKEQGNWAACLAASANPRSLEILYERSWCAYNLDRSGEALAGFTATAQRGAGLGGNVPRDTRFGMILAYLNMNMTEAAAQLAASTDLTREQRVEVEATILDQRGVRAFHSEEYGQSIAYFNALEELSGSLRRDLAMLRGYAYVNNDQQQLALAEFTRLNNELSTEETRDALQALRIMMSGG
jgi:cellulose synthase operon protein C